MIERTDIVRSCFIMSTECPLCNAKNREEIEEKIRDSTFSKSIVAREFQMSTKEVYTHMMEHGGKAEPPQFVRSTEITLNKADLLLNAALDLQDRFSRLLQQDDLDQKTTSQIVQLVETMRKTVMDLAKYEGELEKEQQVTIVHFNEFKTNIFNMLERTNCPKCGQNLKSHLTEELQKFNKEELVA